MRQSFIFFAALATALACAPSTKLFSDSSSRAMDAEASKVRVQADESQTLSFLGNIDSAIAAYYHDTGSIPPDIKSLVPKYLFEIPIVELGLTDYRNTRMVTVYPPSILKDGRVNGEKIKNTGGWGYVVNGNQVIAFVDSTAALRYPLDTHAPKYWYQQSGAR